MRLLAILCASLLLAGCAHRSPAVRTTAEAAAPVPGSVRIIGGADGVADQVAAELAAHGWRPVSEGAPAKYLLLASYGDRPAQVGAFVPSQNAAEPEWAAERIPRRPWTLFKRGRRTLGLVVFDAASGRELRRTSATLDYWRRSDREAVRRLAAAAVAALTPPS